MIIKLEKIDVKTIKSRIRIVWNLKENFKKADKSLSRVAKCLYCSLKRLKTTLLTLKAKQVAKLPKVKEI